mgnify:CR=1 FL=1
MTLWRSIGMGVLLVAALVAVLWLMSRPVVLPPADSRQDGMADMPGMESKGGEESGVRREGFRPRRTSGF